MTLGLYETIWDEMKILLKDFIVLFFKLAVLSALPREKMERHWVFATSEKAWIGCFKRYELVTLSLLCGRVLSLAFLMPNFRNLALFKSVCHKKFDLAFWHFLAFF